MRTRAAVIVLATVLLYVGATAYAEAPHEELARVVAESRAIAGDNENGTVFLYYDHGVVLGPFAGIQGTAYPVPCGNPAIGLFPASARGFFAEKKASLSAYLRPVAGESGCELFISESTLVTHPIDPSWVRPDGIYPPSNSGSIAEEDEDDESDE